MRRMAIGTCSNGAYMLMNYKEIAQHGLIAISSLNEH